VVGEKLMVLVLLSASMGLAQQPASKPPSPINTIEVVVVTGTFEPIPLSESNRQVLSFDVQSQPLL